MVIKNVVIVMALYDIGRDKWNNFNLSYNTYLYWMRNTLSLNSKFVIYTEPKFYDKIIEYRKEFDSELRNTIIVVTPLEELDCYKKYNTRLEELMYSDEFKKKDHHKVPETCEPLYNIIMFNKLNFLKHTKDSNYFNCDFLIWADAGGLRDNISKYEGEIWPSLNKINKLDTNKITFFSHTPDFNIEDNEFHSLSQIRNIQGTSFFVPSHMIDDLLMEFNETIEESLSKNFIGSDEKVFDITYCKNKNKYNLIKCTWRKYFDIFKDKDENDNMKNIFLDLGTHECQGLNHFINYELDIDNMWEIHTFEPNPLIDVEKCIENFTHYNITVHRKAVWIKTGKVIFKQYGDNGTSQGSLLEETEGGKTYADYYSQTEVDCINLYEFIQSLDLNSNIYIKMDVEWAEYEIINHMLSLGWPKNIKKIWIEWHNIHDDEYRKKSEILKSKIEEHKTKVINWH
jgi:FkbM family methyltransferase